ncbi:MAG: NahK/ErcS family hybrid sensor histidine kinase/response regulator [Amphritea sp.]
MKKRSDSSPADTPQQGTPETGITVENLMGLGGHSARKSYYSELAGKLEELEEERNRYKWIFENAQHGIFQADLDGGLRVANPALASICGYQTPQAICEQVTNLCVDLLYRPREYAELTDKLLAYGKLFGYETEFKRRDGSPVSISMNVLLKQQADGVVIEAFVQDITERKRAQGKLRKLNEELEQRVETRTHELVTLNDKLWQEISEREQIEKELKVAKEAAEDANKSKDKYLAAASHDLLQPLNAARLLVSTLRERELQHNDKHLVERIHLALDGAEELLTDLLDISRLDQNAVQPDIINFPLSYLFNALKVEFQPVARENDIDLRVVDCNLGVASDTRLLMRILRNFLSNAFRYTESGRVLLGARRRGDSLSLQIWDTGPGIPQDRLKDIFLEFQQLEEQQRGGKKGVGLGLAIVERIAKMLNHPITVISQPGKGTMFAVEVPISNHSFSVTRERAPVDYNSSLDGYRVMVIDNEESILLSMEALLEQWGCDVYQAASEAEAVQLCQQQALKPDIILADYHLDQGQTGVDAIMALYKQLGCAIPAVIITADRSNESRKLFRECQLPVLNKPVKPGKLRALISHLLTP